MAAALLLHFGNGELRDVKEAGEIDGHDRRVVGLGALGERFGDKDAALLTSVSMRSNRTMPSEIARSAVFPALVITATFCSMPMLTSFYPASQGIGAALALPRRLESMN
jgi:hypothetical protein